MTKREDEMSDDLINNENTALRFLGYYGDGDQDDPNLAPWETFSICLHGAEAGDYVDPDAVQRVLDASGYRLVLEKI